MGANLRLDIKDGLFRIDADGHQHGQTFIGACSEFRRFLGHGDGVHIGQTKKTIVFILKGNPVFHGAVIVADGKRARRLNGRVNSFFLLHVVSFHVGMMFDVSLYYCQYGMMIF